MSIKDSDYWDEKQANDKADNDEISTVENKRHHDLHEFYQKYRGEDLNHSLSAVAFRFFEHEELIKRLPKAIVGEIENMLIDTIIDIFTKLPFFKTVIKGDFNMFAIVFRDEEDIDYIIYGLRQLYFKTAEVQRYLDERYKINYRPSVAIGISRVQSNNVIAKGVWNLDKQEQQSYLNAAKVALKYAEFYMKDLGIPICIDTWVYDHFSQQMQILIKQVSFGHYDVSNCFDKIYFNFKNLIKVI